jgi:regulator of nucleoside diphosphate kinase
MTVMEKTRSRTKRPPIYIEEAHYDRLYALATAFLDRMPEAAGTLLEEIERARIVKACGDRAIVTMGTEVTYRDERSGRIEIVRLVYPDEADIAERKVSVLTPVGAALIGVPEGGTIAWQGRDGERRLTVLALAR